MNEVKYEKDLLQCASDLDALLNAKGKVSEFALNVVQNKGDEFAVKLCGIINKLASMKEKVAISKAFELKGALVNIYGYRQLSSICKQQEKISKEEEKTLEQLLDDLNNLVGLHKVKSKVNDLIAYQKVQLLRKDAGLSIPRSTLHLAFTGNPGTGKTTVARIVGRIYKKIGLLSKGHFIEVSRTDLIAGYQGQTAHKVKNVIDKAKGGVLFIDEAYSITENDHSDSYGRECLTELTKALEDYREDLVVIVAGYTNPMKQFFDSNPGLKSRFNTFIEFDDYGVCELMDILRYISSENDYIVSDRAQELLERLIDNVIDSKMNEFANGRYIRNIFESMMMNHARRIVKIESPTIQELRELTEDDIPPNF